MANLVIASIVVLALVSVVLLQRRWASFSRSVLASLPVPTAVLDRFGRVLYINEALRSHGVSTLFEGLEVGSNYVERLRGLALEYPPAGSLAYAVDAVCAGSSGRGLDYRHQSDPEDRWFSIDIAPLHRGAGGALVVHRPIVKSVPAAPVEVDGHFQRIADGAPVMLWTSGPDGACTYVNRSWLEFTGRRLDQEMGFGWSRGVHPDDLARCLGAHAQAMERREPFRIEYRLRSARGTYRCVLHAGTPWHEENGEFAGHIGSVIDITERRQSERAQRELSGRMIAAQEDERRHLARELHDDLSQRVTLLALQLQECGKGRNDLAATPRWKALTQSVQEIAMDLHRISHHLHPTRLEAVGLVGSIKALCRELGEQHGLDVRFTATDVPRTLPPDVTLCLYRITQEALQNVVKHSGATKAEVFLINDDGELSLRIADSGSGFVFSGPHPAGLGLISMQERALLVGGEIVVHTAPGSGTRIAARVRLPGAAEALRTA